VEWCKSGKVEWWNGGKVEWCKSGKVEWWKSGKVEWWKSEKVGKDGENIRSFRDLEVWKKAMDLSVNIYDITNEFPASENYGLISQLRRAAISIPSNIAEGSSRNSTKEFIQFLHISNGSLSEIETQLEIAIRLKYMKSNPVQPQINHIRSMLTGLIKSLKNKL
jgi:four helix bundle protein